MKTFKQILLAAALLVGSTCTLGAQEKTTTAARARSQVEQRRGDAPLWSRHFPTAQR